MERMFVLCKECAFNLSSSSHKVVCSVMALEEPVVIKNKRGKAQGCRSGYHYDDAFPDDF